MVRGSLPPASGRRHGQDVEELTWVSAPASLSPSTMNGHGRHCPSQAIAPRNFPLPRTATLLLSFCPGTGYLRTQTIGWPLTCRSANHRNCTTERTQYLTQVTSRQWPTSGENMCIKDKIAYQSHRSQKILPAP